MVTFTELIIFSTVALSSLLLVVQFLSSKRTGPAEWQGNSFVTKVLGVACLVSSGLLLLLSFFTRGNAWFIVRIFSLTAVTFYALFKRTSSPIIPLYLFINVISSCIAPMVSLGFSAGETDQIGHIMAANFVLTSHHISPAEDSALNIAQYYNLFPVQDFLVSSTSLFNGLSTFASFAILQIVLPILVTSALVAISYSVSKSYLPAVVGVLILLATDRLAIWVLIPQNLSLELAFVSLFCLILFLARPSTTHGLLVLIFSLFSNFVHASFGGFLLLTIALLAIVMTWQKVKFGTKISRLALGLIVGLVSYWTIWNVSRAVNGQIKFVLTTFLHAFAGKVTVAVGARHQSLVALITPYSFLSWALPPALAFSYAAYYLLSNRFRVRNRFDAFFVSCTAIGFLILGIGLFSTFNQGSIALERYTDVPAYVAMMLAGSIGSVTIIRGRRRSLAVLVIGLLIASLAIGSSGIDWAPDQVSSTYGYAGQQDFVTSHSLATLLPQNILVFFSEKLLYVNYWNSTKASSFLTPAAAAVAINGNRSATTSFLVTFSEHRHTNVYYAIGTSLVKDYGNLVNSSTMDFVYSNSQYVVIESQR